MTSCRGALGVVLLSSAGPLHAQIVINEIFYRAPGDIPDLQWIELHNTADRRVVLSGWRLTKGGTSVFPAGPTIAARGQGVICRNPERFQQFSAVPVAGEFTQVLKRDGERLDIPRWTPVAKGLS
jgi:hypothetical protein